MYVPVRDAKIASPSRPAIEPVKRGKERGE